MQIKTQEQLIKYYKNQFNKVLIAHGADSDFVIHAMFLLKGARMGIIQTDLFTWTNNKLEDLHKEELNLL